MTRQPSLHRLIWAALPLMGGCITRPYNPAATQPVTQVNPATTQPAYWLDQPTTATVRSADFDRLWNACDQTARDFLFDIDRTDYRMGLLTTKPLIGKQFFEFWRRDVATPHDLAVSSLATLRRTVQFELHRPDDGSYEAAVKVLVEREALENRRITSAVEYDRVFNPPPGETNRNEETGRIALPKYWYAVGRDGPLEMQIAQAVRNKLR